MRKTLSIILVCLFSLPALSQAILTIEITQGEATGLPIAVVEFGWQGKGKGKVPQQAPQNIGQIIESDLRRSGKFNPVPKKDFISQPHTNSDVVFKDWRIARAEALLIGNVTEVAGKRYQVEFRLYDVFKQTQLAGFRYTVSADMLRLVAHQISDLVYEKLTGEPGAFTAQIAYVTKEYRREQGRNRVVFKLQVADSDGYGPRTVVTSKEPLLSPSWSVDARRLAYVSFEHRRPIVYIQNLASGKRQKLSGFKGINSAPAFSPDGKNIALTLSKDGNPEIYVMNLANRRLQRLTKNRAIDTEPAWSPDGQRLVFTSDRAGKPQIYMMDRDGANVERMTFEGSYNARASYSPDGKRLTLVTRENGKYHIGVLYLNDRSLHVVTDTQLDESPSFSPNGAIIIYATEVRGRGVLASVSSDGRMRQLYRFETGDVREPAWSPINQQLRYQ